MKICAGHDASSGTVYGAVQGLTEFLGVSSSAHLTPLPWFFGREDPGLGFDVALHVGTLLAVVWYFWRDWWELASAAATSIGDRSAPHDERAMLGFAAIGGLTRYVRSWFYLPFAIYRFALAALVCAVILSRG